MLAAIETQNATRKFTSTSLDDQVDLIRVSYPAAGTARARVECSDQLFPDRDSYTYAHKVNGTSSVYAVRSAIAALYLSKNSSQGY